MSGTVTVYKREKTIEEKGRYCTYLFFKWESDWRAPTAHSSDKTYPIRVSSNTLPNDSLLVTHAKRTRLFEQVLKYNR